MGDLSVLLAAKCVKDLRTLDIESEDIVREFVRGWYYGRGMQKVIHLPEFTAYIFSALYDTHSLDSKGRT